MRKGSRGGGRSACLGEHYVKSLSEDSKHSSLERRSITSSGIEMEGGILLCLYCRQIGYRTLERQTVNSSGLTRHKTFELAKEKPYKGRESVTDEDIGYRICINLFDFMQLLVL